MTAPAPQGQVVRKLIVATRSWLASVKPDRKSFGKDAVAGIPGAISSVPDGMASAVLVGVNPVHGRTRASPARLQEGSPPAPS